MTHSTRASPALQALAERDPALAALSLWCLHRDGAATQTTDDTISYGPDFPDLAIHAQIGLAAHHILHVALRHPARLAQLEARLGAAFDPDLYNLVSDAIVNETLLLADYALPRPAVTLMGLLSKGLGQDLTPQEALAAWDADRLYHALTKAAQGSGEDRAQTYAQAQKFQPDLRAGSAGETHEAEAAARWRQHMARALDLGRQAGRGLGRVGHRIADIPVPTTPWELILRRLLSNAVMQTPQVSPQRPSRHWIATAAQAARAGTPTPGFAPGRKPQTDVARIVVALDASGSVDDARLALFWGEVCGIARRMAAELHVLVFDDDVRISQRIDPSQNHIPLPDMPRGGGTAFAPVIGAAVRLRASALIILTDLDGDAGPPPKGLPVFWTVPDGITADPPFGRLINMAA